MLNIRSKGTKPIKGTGLSNPKSIGIKKQDALEIVVQPSNIHASNCGSKKTIHNEGKSSKIKTNNQLTANTCPLLIENSGNNIVSTRLQGSLFRKINEFLYTSNSEKAFSEYIKDGNMFENYHKGYEIQKKSWPLDPLDVIISYISKNKHLKIIGDFGCGTAKIGQTFGHIKGYKVYSFDLNCPKEISEKYNITICNMKNIPLSYKVLDLAVFCLSLMGTDWPLFIKEACRALKDGGILIIAEVSSRIEDSQSFVSSLQKQLHLELVQDPTNLTNYFTLFIFRKKLPSANQPTSLPTYIQNLAFSRFSRKNRHYFSSLKYKYGLKLYWIHRVSRNLKSLKLANLPLPNFYHGNKFYIDPKLLKPCMYKKR
ncbi:Rrp8p like methyltransferase involved in rRNA processing [Cryptosporidium sp. chipmunk genotype I]|uniref:Rrp8p like methyltransferase involved in rRNA processing n=1 Tax=Cryptosporidium sp. chipmunk genotype I TaxID=1280935 RepID=UPI00351A923E|nr:Rrp8p like methyltransferase involved in rRNA processing [Cryptosporidium sp. chipmunk genotype I]